MDAFFKVKYIFNCIPTVHIPIKICNPFSAFNFFGISEEDYEELNSE